MVHTAADERWAAGMVRDQLADLYRAMLTCVSRAEGALEFSQEMTGRLQLDADTRAQVARTVDALQTLYHESESR